MTVIPAAIDGLLAVCRAAPGLQGVQVFDGDEVQAPRLKYLVIGLDAEDEYPADGTSLQAGLDGSRRMDIATITCLAWSSSGDTRMKTRRDEADALYSAARSAIEADTRLGGAVTHAEVVSYTYRPVRLEKGAAAQVEFRVQVTAL